MEGQYRSRGHSGRSSAAATATTHSRAINIPNVRDTHEILHGSTENSETLEQMSRLNISARAYTPRVVSDEILPGIPSRHFINRSRSAQDAYTSYTWETESDSRRPSVLRAHSIDEEYFRRKAAQVEHANNNQPLPDETPELRRRNGQSAKPRPDSIPEGTGLFVDHNGQEQDTTEFQPSSAPSHFSSTLHKYKSSSNSSRRTSDTPNHNQEHDLGRLPRSPTHARKMLHLMQTTQGFVQGAAYFRAASWPKYHSSYCRVDTKTGSLLYLYASDASSEDVLIKDLRGCIVKASFDHEVGKSVLVLTANDYKEDIYLRPRRQSSLETWFAALLCWRPVHKSQDLAERRSHLLPVPLPLNREASNVHPSEKLSKVDGSSIIKVGKFSLWDHSEIGRRMIRFPDESSASQPPSLLSGSVWRRVSALFRDDGTLQLFTTPSSVPAVTIKFSLLKRSAIQRLHRSLFNSEFCIGIYPQYSASEDACSRLRPIHLNFENRLLYEVWYVLFRAYATPEIFGPRQPTPPEDVAPPAHVLPGLGSEIDPSSFRIERSIHLSVAEARFHHHQSKEGTLGSDNDYVENPKSKSKRFQVRMLIDGQIKAKTTSKTGGHSENPFWYESFDLLDLPLAATCLTIEVWELSAHSAGETSAPRSPVGATTKHALHRPYLEEQHGHSKDHLRGETIVDIIALMEQKEAERWWPLLDQDGVAVGEVSLKIRGQQDDILMDIDYSELSEILHNFSNTLTIKLAERIPSDLTRLSECLVDIFQVSGRACEWLMSVAEEEIDSTRGEIQTARARYIQRVNSNEEKRGSGSRMRHDDRELIIRDLKQSTTSEVNLLFRGNTILSKSLDTHMKRLGKDYLEETLGAKLRSICEQNPDCEVDPNKVSSTHESQKNWKRLISLTEEVWQLIFQSTSDCPLELRLIFRHIRACAEDRYGIHMRAVPYSSVSGFLFLRFFCPAVLNPKLFGLVPDNPGVKAQRAFTLIAKSLQVLANGSTFGTKQPWMEPMNQFLTSNKQNYKTFIDSICNVSSQQPPPQLELPYSTPLAVFTRLPPACREGFPSLPYLIDHSRSFAALVELWLDLYDASLSSSGTGSTNSIANKPLEDDLLHFHHICSNIRQRTLDANMLAERSESKCNFVSQKWVTIAERMEIAPDEFWIDNLNASVHKQHHLPHLFHTHNGNTTQQLPQQQQQQPQHHLQQHHHHHHPMHHFQQNTPAPNQDTSTNARSRAISSPPTANTPVLIAEYDPSDDDEGRFANSAHGGAVTNWREREREWRAPLSRADNQIDSAASSDTEGAGGLSRPTSATGERASSASGTRKRGEKSRFGIFVRKKKDAKHYNTSNNSNSNNNNNHNHNNVNYSSVIASSPTPTAGGVPMHE